MKKLILSMILALSAGTLIAGNGRDANGLAEYDYYGGSSYYRYDFHLLPRTTYLNLGYNLQTLAFDVPDQEIKLRSDYAVALSVGRTYLLHRRPVARMIWFGIDATWCDLNYGYYSPADGIGMPDTTDEYDMHKAEIGMNVGPSITVSPLRRLQIQAYFRYCPTFAGIAADRTFFGNYGNFFVGGCSISSGVIGGGVEARFGSSRYKQLSGGEGDNYLFDGRGRTHGVRFFVTLRF